MVALKEASLQEKILAGERISAAEALDLYRWPLAELGALADARRNLAKEKNYDGRGREIVTYIVDRNINYTNVCNVYCKFCAFYRTEKDDDHYVLSREQFDQKLDELTAAGGVQILMQGGHHPKLGFDWYLDLLHHIREKYPQINIHGFSPPEFQHFARDVRDAAARSDHTLQGSRARLDSRRGRRNPGRFRPATNRAAEMRERPMARGHAGGARAGIEFERDDDVRPRRDDRGSDRAFAAPARSAGRERRLHRFHLLDVSAASNRPKSRAPDRLHPSIFARRRCPASSSTTSPTSKARG